MSTISTIDPSQFITPQTITELPTPSGYTSTGFGQLPVIRTSSIPRQKAYIQLSLLTFALILSLIGILYILIYVTVSS